VELASSGADILALDICAQIDSVEYPMATRDDLAETARAIEATGRRVLPVVVDVRDRSAVAAACEQGIAHLGRLDIVIANAGILPQTGPAGDTMQAWQDAIDVILTGTLNSLDAVYPFLIDQQQGGSIIVIGSMAALRPMMRTPRGRNLGLLGYASAKLGLVALARNYASLLARYGVRVNVVHPMGVDTPMVNNLMRDDFREGRDEEDLRVLMNAMDVRLLAPEDVTGLIAFLCSDGSRYITGCEFRVDAGAQMR
jgi:NAD(P)-dependent dehydrogenase (short-subunit alcohol dehydrogenase family)